MSKSISLAGYLFTRIRQLGARSVHGVPSDYNMTVLDAIKPTGLHFVGNSNELNAGYAADGYARVKGVGALCTGFGVGELSAINAVGGAYAERAPVVHIVGTPPRAAQKNRMNVHHTLGDGNHRIFAEMYRAVTCAQTNLTDVETARADIDKTLKECLRQKRPVYIELPTDMVNVEVDAGALAAPIDISSSSTAQETEIEEQITKQIMGRIYQAQQPLIIIDAFTRNFGWTKEAKSLAQLTGFPVVTSTGGKDVIDESLPNYYGAYKGACGEEALKKFVDSCDLVLRLGPLDCDTNTFGFSTIPNPAATIDFHNEHIIMDAATPMNISLNTQRILQNINTQLTDKPRSSEFKKPAMKDFAAQISSTPVKTNGPITQDTFYTQISKNFGENDIILTETGTASSGGLDFYLPPSAQLITSPIWLSIGYTLGASAGCAMALRDRGIDEGSGRDIPGRTILFEGDGSFQMTAQSISDIIRNRLDIIIFVINNDGYTIERLIHGMTETYNDVQPWNYLLAPKFFGASLDDPEYPVFTKKVDNWEALTSVMEDERIKQGKGLNVIEVMMEREDGPDCLKRLAAYVEQRNSSYA